MLVLRWRHADDRAYRAGVTAAQPDLAAAPPRSTDGYAAEITWLSRVATAYRQSPLVAATLDATEHLTATAPRPEPVGSTRSTPPTASATKLRSDQHAN